MNITKRRIFRSLLAATMLVLALIAIAMPARAQYQTDTNFLFTMQGIRTNSTAGTTSTVTFTNVGYLGMVGFVTCVSNVSGTSPTFDCKITHSDDNSTFTDVTGAAYPQVTGANTSTNMVIWVRAERLKQYVRLTNSIGGSSTPSFWHSTVVLAPQKYR